MSRRLLAPLFLVTAASCVPVKTTYYEAMDRPWEADGTLTGCPPTHVGIKLGASGSGASYLVVSATHRAGGAQIAVHVGVGRMHQLTFKSWNVRLTSVLDPTIQSFAHLSFSGQCGRFTYCPVPQEPKALVGPERASEPFERDFMGLADVPSEFVAGFVVELPEILDGSEKLDAKPMKFELRTRVLVKGVHGCE